jgi:hypothetical protein
MVFTQTARVTLETLLSGLPVKEGVGMLTVTLREQLLKGLVEPVDKPPLRTTELMRAPVRSNAIRRNGRYVQGQRFVVR